MSAKNANTLFDISLQQWLRITWFMNHTLPENNIKPGKTAIFYLFFKKIAHKLMQNGTFAPNIGGGNYECYGLHALRGGRNHYPG